MNFKVTGIYNRCVTIEMDSPCPYRHEEKTRVLVNGQEKACSDLNVLVLYGFEPDRDYEIEVDGHRQRVHTRKESVLLNVRDFGAAGDGKRNDTPSIQAAISVCPPGGTVYLPEGTYRCTPLFMKSHITLYLGEGAVILGETDRLQYPILPGMVPCTDEVHEISYASWEGNPLSSFASLITAVDVEDLDIIGPGSINGNAESSDWWEDHHQRRIAWRPKTISLNRCCHVRLAGVMVTNSPAWTIHPYYSDHVELCGVYIKNPPVSPNTDGIDPESSSDLRVTGCRICVGDDCIAIKSGKYYMGQYHQKPSSCFEIRNCLFERGHGAVTMGSEIACGVDSVKVDQCIFDGTDRGIRLKTCRGRGNQSTIDHLDFENIVMKNVPMPLTVNMFYFGDPDGHTTYKQSQEALPVDERTPRIGSIIMKHVTCTGVNATLVCAAGLPEMPIECIDLEDVKASFLPSQERKVQETLMMEDFPAVQGMPLYLKNVRKLVLQDVQVTGGALSEDVLLSVPEREIHNYTTEKRK